jgi:hypothetical protein
MDAVEQQARNAENREITLRNLEVYGRAWMTADENLILTIFTEDAIYNDPTEPENHGHEGIRKYWISKVQGEQVRNLMELPCKAKLVSLSFLARHQVYVVARLDRWRRRDCRMACDVQGHQAQAPDRHERSTIDDTTAGFRAVLNDSE